MQRLEVSGAVRHIYIYICIYRSLGVKGLTCCLSRLRGRVSRKGILAKTDRLSFHRAIFRGVTIVPIQNNERKLGSCVVNERIQLLLLVIQGAKFILTLCSQMTD
jgi:hypothetical protein